MVIKLARLSTLSFRVHYNINLLYFFFTFVCICSSYTDVCVRSHPCVAYFHTWVVRPQSECRCRLVPSLCKLRKQGWTTGKFVELLHSLNLILLSGQNLYVSVLIGFDLYRMDEMQVGVWFTYGCAALECEEFTLASTAFRRCVNLDNDVCTAFTYTFAATLSKLLRNILGRFLISGRTQERMLILQTSQEYILGRPQGNIVWKTQERMHILRKNLRKVSIMTFVGPASVGVVFR